MFDLEPVRLVQTARGSVRLGPLGIAVLSAFAIWATIMAPPANAVCLSSYWRPGTQGTCPEEFLGTPEQYLAQPEVMAVTNLIDQIGRGPFLLRSTSEIAGGDGEQQVISTFFRSGVTRRSIRATSLGPGEVTYLNASRVCRRTITESAPNTIAADKQAHWKCRTRKASDVDGAAQLKAWLPSGNIPRAADGNWPANTWLVSTTDKPEWGVTDPKGFLLGYVVGTSRCLESHSYESNDGGYTFTWWMPACSTPESAGDRVNVSTSNIPKLANMGSFKTK